MFNNIILIISNIYKNLFFNNDKLEIETDNLITDGYDNLITDDYDKIKHHIETIIKKLNQNSENDNIIESIETLKYLFKSNIHFNEVKYNFINKIIDDIKIDLEYENKTLTEIIENENESFEKKIKRCDSKYREESLKLYNYKCPVTFFLSNRCQVCHIKEFKDCKNNQDLYNKYNIKNSILLDSSIHKLWDDYDYFYLTYNKDSDDKTPYFKLNSKYNIDDEVIVGNGIVNILNKPIKQLDNDESRNMIDYRIKHSKFYFN